MNNLSKEEYLRLLEQYADDLYGDDTLGADDYQTLEESWMPAESPMKEFMKKVGGVGSLDLTNFKKNKIKESIFNCTNLKVGSFLIRIEEYHGQPSKNNSGSDLSVDLSLWEEKYTTPSGNPCRMTYRVNLSEDDRFTNRPWLSYFMVGTVLGNSTAHYVPIDTVVDIVRWMQAIKKLSAFS